MRRIIITAVLAASTIGAIALPSSASAAPPNCQFGYFCANTDSNFNGLQVNWYGDDGWWESNIADQDSSWANSGDPDDPLDHVKVFEDAWSGGAVTICLAAGQVVNYKAGANDRGDSHQWTSRC